MIRVAASLCSAASGATAATGAGMRQVTDSRKATARYRAEYLRLSNAPTSAAATCDNTVRCACATPPHSHHLSSLHSKRHWVRNQSRDLGAFYTRIRTFLLDTTRSSNTSRCYVWPILMTKLPWSLQHCFDSKQT